METPKIGELVARYDFPNGDYITLRHKDGKVRITSASMNTETGKEVTDAIADFKSRIAEKKEEPKPAPKPKKATKSVGKDGRRIWTAEERTDIIRRYQEGENPKAIGDSLGVSRMSIQQIIHHAGVTEGRSGDNLKKSETKPEEKEPV
jgi:DNA-directed RNA polymerase subunit N (RpoN/RPB10)